MKNEHMRTAQERRAVKRQRKLYLWLTSTAAPRIIVEKNKRDDAIGEEIVNWEELIAAQRMELQDIEF